MMQMKRHITLYSRWLSCLLYVAAGLFVSCTSVEDEHTPTPGQPMENAGGTLQFTSVGQLGDITRSASSLNSIQLFLASKQTTDTDWYLRKARVNYRENTQSWQSLATVKQDTTYYIYGFMPADAGATPTIAPLSDDDYAKGAIMTLTGLPTVTTQDICIMVGVNSVTNKEDLSTVEGQFTYTGLASGNMANLLFDHLYAAVNFNIRIDANYAKLRDIKLKSMQVTTDKETAMVTINLKPNTKNISPLDDAIEFTYPITTGSSTVDIAVNEGKGLDLTTAWLTKPIEGFLSPENAISTAGTVRLVTIYNVYDKKGNLLREDCRAENKLPALSTVKRGKKTVLQLTVKPTYLYMLSDPDLNNPSVTLN